VENLLIDDSNITNSSYSGPFVFGTFRSDTSAENLLPYETPEEVILKNVKVVSGKELRLSPNRELFKDTQMKGKSQRVEKAKTTR